MAFSSKLGEAQIEIRASTDRLKKDLGNARRSVKDSLAGMQSKLKGFGKAASIGLTAPLILFGKKAVEAAAAAEEMESKLSVVFGNSSDSVRDWADETAKAVGRSSFELRKAAADTQSLLISAGLASDEATEMSKAMTQLAIDTASFNDSTDAQAINAFQKALLGENEALKGIGLSLSAAEVKAQALKMGFAGQVTEMDAATKAAATYQALLLKTSQMQGDAARTAGSSTNQMKALGAAMTELSIVVGTQILPILTPMITALTSVLTAFTNLPAPVQQMAVAVAAFAAVIGPLALILGTVSLPLLAIAAAAAAVFVAFQNFGKVKAIVRDMFNGINKWLGDKLTSLLDLVGDKVEKVTGFFFDMWDKVVGNSFVPDMVDGIETHFARLASVMVNPALAATDKVSAAFSSLQDTVKDSVSNVFDSLQNITSSPLLNSFLNPVIKSAGSIFGSLVGGLFGGGAPTTGLANGGPINKPTLVGERGPEMFMPGQAGTIVSNKSMGGGVVINQNISLMPDVGQAFKQQLAQSMPMIRNAAIAGVAESQARRGGPGRA